MSIVPPAALRRALPGPPAGICEELLYRGYLVWVLQPWLGLYGAMFASVVLFGLGHSYQGRRGMLRATLAGAAMATIVLASGWLVPAMIVHAVIDASAGVVSHAILKEERTLPPSHVVATSLSGSPE